jgi:hypothetical protein
MSEEYIADRGHQSDGPVDLDELHEQEENSSTADRWRRSDGPIDLDKFYEHKQKQYTSSFRPVSHKSIVSRKNNNASLPHCCAIAATNNNTSNNSDNNINDTSNRRNNVQSNNSIIIDSFPRSIPISLSSSNNNNVNNNNNNNNINKETYPPDTYSIRALNSMSNISRTSNDSNVSINPKINTEIYPPDTYSILALHGPIENPAYFSFGLMVYLLQMTFLLLMVLSVVHPRWSSIGNVDNPDEGWDGIVQQIARFTPSQVSPLVRTTQIMATLTYIIFANSTIRDIAVGVELFPSFKQKTPDDKIGCMVFSSILRLSQGILAIIVTLFLIITTSDVIEIILNFTAVNFISNLDDVGFEVIKWGKYGRKFQKEAQRIEKEPLPQCINRKHKDKLYWCSVIPIGVVLIAFLCGIFFLQGSNDHWVTKIFRVQFQDKEQGLQVYNGCYEKNEVDIGRKDENGRKLYKDFEYNSESAQFGFCIDDHRWILFKDNRTNACEARGNKTEVAHSSKTDTFDVSTMFGETWYSSSNTPLDVYFFEDDGDIKINKTTCSLFLNDGNCDLVFNTFDYQYDGGDCCAATCSGSNCGIGSISDAFGTGKTSGDGFPNCVDPVMVPITIHLDNILNIREPQAVGFLTLEPVKPLLSIDCDESNILSIYVDKSMEYQNETIMVNDGADCTMTISNTTTNDYDPIWYVNYTISNGPMVVLQDYSYERTTTYFQPISNCYLDKLSDHTDWSTVYMGIDNDPSAKAIDWLTDNESEIPMCKDSFFLERYALAVIYFAAPSNNGNYQFIRRTRQCNWPGIKCDNGAVVDLDLSKCVVPLFHFIMMYCSISRFLIFDYNRFQQS